MSPRHDRPSPARRALPPRVLLRRPALAAPWRRIEHIAGLPAAHFDALYLATMTALLDHVQLLPVPALYARTDEVPFVETALARAARALSLARGQLLPPGRATEDAKDYQHVWRYGLFSAQLLRGIEQVALGQAVHRWGRFGDRRCWDPLAGPLRRNWGTAWYAVAGPLPAPPAAACLRLAARIVPPRALTWLCSDPDAYTAWARTLGAAPTPTTGAPTSAPADSDVPNASTDAMEINATSTGPSSAVSSVQPPPEAPRGRELGHAFQTWLWRSIADGALRVDEDDALLFRMSDGAIALRTPHTFQCYAAQTGTDWKAVQQGFLKLRVHRRATGRNFSELEVTGGRHYPVVILPLARNAPPVEPMPE